MKLASLPAAVAASAVLGVGGVAFALTSGSSPTPLSASQASATTTPSGTHNGLGQACKKANAQASGKTGVCNKGALKKMLKKRGVHAEVIFKGKNNTWVTVDEDRGTVANVSSTSITVSRPDGVSVTAPITSTTKFRGLPESKIVSGDRVILVEKDHSAVLIATAAPKTSTNS
ncbi:MAG: hypothetical protein HKL80_04445 [Acidimicrobiales bacterium]|nr:hypothetical protein [Acidimicrobiales bacterium]